MYLQKTYLHGKFTFNFLNSTYDTACCIGIGYQTYSKRKSNLPLLQKIFEF